MLLRIADWAFEVDFVQNMDVSAQQAKEHCTCGYCRNYYMALDRCYPGIRSFLANFGIDPEGPDELSPFEPTIYEASFIVNGRIVERGMKHLYIDGIPVRILNAQDADMDTERSEPYFVLIIGLMELPWLLNEPADQVVSPANEQAYMIRMQKKLMHLMSETEMS